PHQKPYQEYTATKKITSYSKSASFLGLLAPSNYAYTTDRVGDSGYCPGDDRCNSVSPNSSADFTNHFGGTSAAAPYASGAVAVLQSAAASMLGRRLTPQEVRAALTTTGEPLTDPKSGITTPLVNLDAAVDKLPTVRTCEQPCDDGDACTGVETC